jgi:peptide/nickel transport system substrate-binding protein
VNRRPPAVLALTMVALALAVLALGGCAGGSGSSALGHETQARGHQEINPTPRDQVRDGGTLRLPLLEQPYNFNYNQVDGTSGDVLAISYATLPHLFTTSPTGDPVINHNYLTSARLTSTTPQVVTYTINPQAVWSDGTPITWRDFEAYWRSENGTNPAYLVSGTVGYSDISSVARGADDRQAVVTFSHPVGEWEGLFSPFTPASLTSTPQAYNTAWKTAMPVTSGPFLVRSVDPTAKIVTLVRDTRWWGIRPKLDQVIFRAIPKAAQPDALANNELDYYEVGSDLNLFLRGQRAPGATVRGAPGPYLTHITFNGSPGAPLADPRVRRAVAQSIDRADVTRRLIGRIVADPVPAGNHVFLPGSEHYQDNADVLPYDPAGAARALDQAGWVRTGATRSKDGRQLKLRLTMNEDPASRDAALAVQNQLGQLGITVEVLPQPFNRMISAVTKGDFDMASFSWGTTNTPLTSGVDIYGRPIGDNVRQNYGRVGSPELDALYAQGIQEFDPVKRAELGNRADRLIWQNAHSIILFNRPGAVAVRTNLANFGAWGLATWDFSNAGFLR